MRVRTKTAIESKLEWTFGLDGDCRSTADLGRERGRFGYRCSRTICRCFRDGKTRGAFSNDRIAPGAGAVSCFLPFMLYKCYYFPLEITLGKKGTNKEPETLRWALPEIGSHAHHPRCSVSHANDVKQRRKP